MEMTDFQGLDIRIQSNDGVIHVIHVIHILFLPGSKFDLFSRLHGLVRRVENLHHNHVRFERRKTRRLDFLSYDCGQI